MKLGLSNNQLKILAMVAMTLDHVGAFLFPHTLWLRVVGRLAFPIYAFMIAEGCRHSRSLPKYLLSLGAMAALCQAVDLVARGSLYMCILVTFSLSVSLILLIRQAEKRPSWWLAVGFATLGALFFCEGLPRLFPQSGFAVDYNFIGVMVPVVLYLMKNKWLQLLALAGLLLALCYDAWIGQLWSLLAVPLLALYNGTRGKWKLKWFFYLFYPVHLVVIYFIGFLIY